MTPRRADAAPLLARIEAYGFSEADDPLGFESRLADDNGWTLGHALAVATEYRRFLVLTQLAGQAVSPSPDVDQAWHLHLTRTAHYEAFCAALFGRFLHHAPARPGEGARHREMYEATLAAYREAFAADAPEAIWPADGRRIEVVKAAPGWTVPVALRHGANLAFAVVLGAAAVGLLLRVAEPLDPLQGIGPFPFLGVATLATLALAFLGFSRREPAATPDGRDVLEPYEVAWLSGGLERMAMTAVVTLIERGVLLPPGPSPQRGPRPPIPVNRTVVARAMHPVEAACLSAVTDEGLRFSAACAATVPVAAAFRHRLVAAGHASGADVLPRRRALALAGLAVLLAIEFERLFHAQGTHQRLGFLFMLTLVQVLLTVVFVKRTQRASPRAEAVLRPLRLSAGRYKKTPPVGPALAFGVALAGGAALADDLRFDGLGQQANAVAAARRAAGNGGGDDGDSSCSSCGSDGGFGGDGGGSSCSSGCGGGGD